MKIEGNKIILRDWILSDLEDYRFWSTGKHAWMDFDAPYFKRANSEELEKYLTQIKQKVSDNNFPEKRSRLIIADKETNQFLGLVSWYYQEKQTNWKSIGIIIFNQKYWTKGIGSDAFKLWVSYVFESDKSLQRVDLRTWSGNQRMIKLGKKLGFQQEACFRNAREVNGKFFDSIAMGILREEWENKIV